MSKRSLITYYCSPLSFPIREEIDLILGVRMIGYQRTMSIDYALGVVCTTPMHFILALAFYAFIDLAFSIDNLKVQPFEREILQNKRKKVGF